MFGLFLCASAQAFKPETISVKPAIDPGSNVLVNQAEWAGASKIHVYGQQDLSYKGSVSVGLTSQILLGRDQKTLYTLSDYMKRLTRGPVESVIEEYDIATLSLKREIVIPNKAVKAIGMAQLLEQSADGRYLYVQNATPATSVTVVDLQAGEAVLEVPTPGCYGVFPAPRDNRFSTLCGAGDLKTYSVNGDQYDTTSISLFSPEQDPLYVQAQRTADGRLVFLSFNGTLYLVDDGDATAKLLGTVPLTKGVNGDWAPGGYVVMAYSPATNMMFVLMHPDAYEGSHKDPSEEIWSVDMKSAKVIGRSHAEGLIALAVSQGQEPVLFGTTDEDETIERFALLDNTKFVFKAAGSDDKSGWASSLLTVGE
ncbi:hypothetical protein GCM10007426_30860 [Alloalcanivorax dieselolei]|nr:hypothetical protein GCM10007426_30860 [Alloalcanivorax dieselolei]